MGHKENRAYLLRSWVEELGTTSMIGLMEFSGSVLRHRPYTVTRTGDTAPLLVTQPNPKRQPTNLYYIIFCPVTCPRLTIVAIMARLAR